MSSGQTNPYCLENPAVSRQPQVSLQNTAEDIALKSMRAASNAGSQSEALFTRTF
jgi:hypothetical protein